MAAAIVPLIAGLAPSIITLITNLVHAFAPAAEQQMGPGTGPAKFGQVFSDVMQALTAAAATGQIDKTLPPDNEVQLIIQAVVSSMQTSGQLGSMPPSASKIDSMGLKVGQSITITGIA